MSVAPLPLSGGPVLLARARLLILRPRVGATIMAAHSLAMPPQLEAIALQLRLCSGEATAPADLCQAYLQPLAQSLEARFPQIDPHLCMTAAEDALIEHCKKPTAYDPGRHSLGGYLLMAARRDLLNLLNQERRRKEHFPSVPYVEDASDSRNLWRDHEEPADQLMAEEDARAARAAIQSVHAQLSPQEQRVLTEMLAGERRTSVFAEHLGVSHLPGRDQEVAVKRAKDRIKKRIQRAGDPHD